jgi:hypothetical protein
MSKINSSEVRRSWLQEGTGDAAFAGHRVEDHQQLSRPHLSNYDRSGIYGWANSVSEKSLGLRKMPIATEL